MKRTLSFPALLGVVSLLVIAAECALPAMQSDYYGEQATRQEISEFQQFLVTHPWIAKKVRENPSLANNQDFLNGNPELPRFLNAHPFVQSGLKSDASTFMRRVQDSTLAPQSQYGSDWSSRQGPGSSPEIRDLRQFLNDHSWLAQQLQNDPSLANNQDFLNGNPEFAQFLSDHPSVQRGLQANAAGYIRRAQRYGQTGPEMGSNWNSWNNQANNQEMSDFNHFLTSHPWIANKLRGNPSLANNQDFLHDNPPLPQFLNSHPFAQAQMKSDPGAFMQRARDFASGGSQAGGLDPHGADIAVLHQFILNHPWIGKQLRQNPRSANNDDFLNGNKEFKDFLAAHEYLQQQFKQDPRAVMDRERALGGQF